MAKKLYGTVLILMLVTGVILLLRPQKETLSLEKRAAARTSDLSVSEVMDGSFTDQLNSVFEDQMFYREKMIKGYYSIKNILVKPFSSGNSETVECEILSDEVASIGDGYLINNIFETDWDTVIENVRNRGYNLRYVADQYPDVKTYVYYPTRIEDTNLLDNGILDSRFDEFEEAFRYELGDNIKYRKLEINSLEDFEKYYFHTDHHWNIDGVYQGYSDIINMIREDFEIDEPRKILSRIDYDYDFYGTYARKIGNAVDTVDHISDYDLGISTDDYDCYFNGEKRDITEMKSYYAKYGLTQEDGSNDDYEIYFDYGCLERRFEFHDEDKPNILIFADSFVNPLKDWLASHFNTTVILDMRHADEDFDLDYYIKTYDIDIMLNLEYFDSLYFSGYFFIPVHYD